MTDLLKTIKNFKGDILISMPLLDTEIFVKVYKNDLINRLSEPGIAEQMYIISQYNTAIYLSPRSPE